MSMDPEREEFWQTIARSTIKERCKAIFNQELLSDVKFAVCREGGSGSKTIPAHKFVLAISSPVFFAMFYGDLPERDCVEIPDCDYESLLEVLRFIYSDEVNLTPGNVMQVLYLAKKYMLPILAEKCSVYLKENLDASSVFLVLPQAQKYEQKDLMDHCWKLIETETVEAVKSDGFVAIERSVLEGLVERDSLNIKEVELFKAVNCWAGNECEKQGLKAEGSVKRRLLGERIVKGIRFPVMEQKEFAGVVLDCGILTYKETCDLVKYFNCVPNTSLDFLIERRKDPLVRRVSRFSSVVEGWKHSAACFDRIIFSFDKDINLCTVRLFASKNNEFRLSSFCVKEEGSNIILADTKQANFLSKHVESEIGNYPGFDIEFEPPIALKANIRYVFHANIDAALTWYGEGGKTCVQHSGVNFYFDDLCKTSTCVERGQFSEFLFTIA
ncbi:PHR domain [Porites harrisoni]